MYRETGVVKIPSRTDSFPRCRLKGRHEQHLSQRGRWIHSCVIVVNTKEVAPREFYPERDGDRTAVQRVVRVAGPCSKVT